MRRFRTQHGVRLGVRASSRRRFAGGFTLPEAALTMAIVGMGVLSVVRLMAACTQQNRMGDHITTGMMLAANMQEALTPLPFSDPDGAGGVVIGSEPGETTLTYDDIDDFHNKSFSPPLDAMRSEIADLARYTQSVVVEYVDPDRPSVTGVATDAKRVTVVITHAEGDGTSREVYRGAWLKIRQ
ncbi:MAG: hypothetical protein ACFCVE_12510 [Phycisphaerae bacterium]